jgi:hypothetical protein
LVSIKEEQLVELVLQRPLASDIAEALVTEAAAKAALQSESTKLTLLQPVLV